MALAHPPVSTVCLVWEDIWLLKLEEYWKTGFTSSGFQLQQAPERESPPLLWRKELLEEVPTFHTLISRILLTKINIKNNIYVNVRHLAELSETAPNFIKVFSDFSFANVI